MFLKTLIMVLSMSVMSNTYDVSCSFQTSDEDSFSFIKSRLTHLCFKSIIEKSLAKSGYDSKKLWSQYTKKLNEKLRLNRVELSKKYQTISAKNRAKLIRDKSYEIEKNFGDLPTLIKSYSITSTQASTKNPSQKIMKMRGEVYLNKLNDFYKSYEISNMKNLGGKNLNVVLNYTNPLFPFSQIGVSNENDFYRVLQQNWSEWILKHKPSYIDSINFISSKQVDSLIDKADISLEKPLVLYLDVYLRKLDFSIKLDRFQMSMKVSGYLAQGDTVLKDGFFSTNKEQKLYENVNMDTLSSFVANHLYRLPIPHFSNLMKKLKVNARNLKSEKIAVKNLKSSGQLFKFLESLTKEYNRYNLGYQISQVSSGVAEVEFYSEASDFSILEAFKKNSGKLELVETNDMASVILK